VSDVLVSIPERTSDAEDGYRLLLPNGEATVTDDGHRIKIWREATPGGRPFALVLTHDEAAVLAEALAELTEEPGA
jgi:hypothetical protein